jgi:foldase protein PrsA
MAGGRVGANKPARRRYALDFLISSQWLIGEVAESGIKLTDQEVHARFEARRKATFPGGEEEFREFLQTTGASRSDLELEVRAELAARKLRKWLTRDERPVSATQIVRYYRRHRQSFLIPERRRLEITNRKTLKEADEAKREVEAGFGFARGAQREALQRTNRPALRPERVMHWRSPLEKAIYLAKPNVPMGPVKRGVDYFVFRVDRIEAMRYRGLAEVEGRIGRELAVQKRRGTLASFIEAWRDKWRSMTNCDPGYIVAKCRQFKSTGRTPREDPYELS